MQRAGNLLTTIWLSIAASITLLYALAAHNHQQLFTVSNDAPQLALQRGDAVLVLPLEERQPHIGDVVAMRDHNLKTIGYMRLTSSTKPADMVGTVTTLAPKLGYVLRAIQQPRYLIGFVYLPGAVVVGNALKQFHWQHTNKPTYRLTAYNR